MLRLSSVLSVVQQRLAVVSSKTLAEDVRLNRLCVNRSKGRSIVTCCSRSIITQVISFPRVFQRHSYFTLVRNLKLSRTVDCRNYSIKSACNNNLISVQFLAYYSNCRTMSSLFIRVVASAVKAADRGGLIVRDILKAGDLGIVEKTGANDLQTEADRSCQRCILASLHKNFPDLTVIGEEEEDLTPVKPDWVESALSDEVLKYEDSLPAELKQVKNEDLQWTYAHSICVWVDPLDGTAEFTQGLLDHVTVLIGIAVNGKAVGGVIHQPFYNYQAGPDAQLGRTIWGVVGLGAYGFQPHKPDPTKRIVVTTRSHGTEAVRNAIAACEPTEVQKVGGAGHKVLLLIEGKAHAYIFASPGCKKWDTCAPEAVLHAIGGKLTDMHGNAFQYHSTVKHPNSGGVLGTAIAEELDWYLSKIPAEVRDGLPA